MVIILFSLLTIQMQNLAEQKQMSLVQTEPPSTYIKKGGKVGRPKNIDKIAKSNTKISEFFAPAGDRQ